MIEKSGIPYFWAVGMGLLVIIAVSSPRLRKRCFVTGRRAMSGRIFFSLVTIMMAIQVVASVYSLVFEKFVNLFGISAMQQLEAATHSSQTISMLLYAGFLGPVTEEIIFRGYLLRSLEKYGSALAITISAYMFGLYHSNFIQSPFAFMVGLVLGYVAITYGIKWSISLHIFNNFILGDFLTFFLRRFMPQQVEKASSMIIFIGGLVGLYLLLRKREKIFAWWNSKRSELPYLKAAFLNKYLLVITVLVLGLACLGLTRV
ncbi:CPBP family intramembrane glutamic endopeptidase [Liquorilactobacillus oeni]|nr:CPBP family intramembrane glutamic endopeptidase [Liquorilactobacillus oeni]